MRFVAITTVLCLAGVSPVAAQSISAADPGGMVLAMRDLGYRATLTTDSYGDPMIESSASGVDFDILFYGCQSGAACLDVQFVSGFDLQKGMSEAAMNSWNVNKLFGQAYVDEEGDPFLSLAIPGLQGLDMDGFERLVDRWDGALGEFTDYIDF